MPRADLLVIDDLPENLRLLTGMLTMHGYKVRASTTGAHGLAAAQALPPDLILLDILMPEMDGYEVCRRLRTCEATADIPVIFISALDHLDDIVRGFDAGGVDFVTKPFRAGELLARVETHLSLRRLQKDLQSQIEQRDRLIAELDAYAHTVAHDLKGPLGVVANFAEFLQSTCAEAPREQIGEGARYIHKSALKMVSIVNGLLLLASARHEEVPLGALDTAAIVRESLTRLGSEVLATHASVEVPPYWPGAVGYGPWVEEVWVNFLSNALRYGGRPSPTGALPPHVRLGADHVGDSQVRFWVRDDGPGFSARDRSLLFTPFARRARSSAGGSGLGLSIVQRIVERLGGTVGADCTPDEGSIFWFTLPAA